MTRQQTIAHEFVIELNGWLFVARYRGDTLVLIRRV